MFDSFWFLLLYQLGKATIPRYLNMTLDASARDFGDTIQICNQLILSKGDYLDSLGGPSSLTTASAELRLP